MPPAELRATDRHIAECEMCRRQVGEGEKLRELFEFVQADLRATRRPEHLAYEQLEAYVENSVDEVDREIVESHLELCGRCKADLENLQSFKSEMAAYPSKDY